MRLLLLTALVMIAFAANSVLNRAALAGGAIDPMSFAALRTGSGAAALALLLVLRDRRLSLAGPHRAAGVLSLTLYMLSFSVAYVALDAGVGALLLFGAVQVTMFCGALAGRETVPLQRWLGAALALAGLAWLMWPAGPVQLPPLHGALMMAAGVGWGLYSLVGRKSGEPLRATGANFILAAPVCILPALVLPLPDPETSSQWRGVWLALTSGILTSAMGYALWYSVLPRLQASIAALAQLTVPVIALAGGVLLLGEVVTLKLLLASALVLGGVALGVVQTRR